MTSAHDVDRSPARTPGVDAHDTPEGLVLYARRDDTVHQLNAMSTLLYELSDGRSLLSIARSFAEVFDVDDTTARSLVTKGFADLQRLGLVE